MQVLVVFAFLTVWLFIFWSGSLALEATGMERRKARFQALSAITGTGFTTTEAESVVNYPARRRIALWLILLGNTGVLSFIVALVVTVRSGLESPSLVVTIVVVAAVLLAVVGIWAGVVGRISDLVLRLMARGPGRRVRVIREVLHQAGPYGVVRIEVDEEVGRKAVSVGDTGLAAKGVSVLAVERRDTVLVLPAAEEPLQPGDRLLCYGEIESITV